MNNPKLYTVKEAAKLVGVSTNTLYKYLDEDRIHAARGSAIQGRFRIPQSALEEFLGITLSQPEQVTPVPSGSDPASRQGGLNGSAQPRDIQSAEGQTLMDQKIEPRLTGTLEHRTTGLPVKLARFLLVLALLAVLLDLIISQSVSLATQATRILFLLVMLLLAYQEGGYRRS
jgi:excisionase family DNA binding protein